MTKVLALDQSTVTGWTVAGSKLPIDQWQSGRFKAPKRDEIGERLIIIEDGVLRLIDKFTPDLIALEEPWNPLRELVEAARGGKQTIRGGYNLSTINLLQMVKGTVLMAAARRSLPTESYSPRSWRTVLKLPSRPPSVDNEWVKRETLAAVRRLGGKVENFDEADSWGLAFYCLHGKAGIERATANLFDRAKALL